MSRRGTDIRTQTSNDDTSKTIPGQSAFLTFARASLRALRCFTGSAFPGAAIVPAVLGALQVTRAKRIFVANLGPQVPETAGFTVAAEVAALARHGVVLDAIVVDPGRDLGDIGAVADGVPVVVRPVAAGRKRVHDPALLAAVLVDLAT